MNATQIIKLIDEALTQFGKYSYFDKGPVEVMDVTKIVTALNAAPVEKCKATLLELLKLEPKRGKRAGTHSMLVRTLLVDMQDVEDSRWNALMADPLLEKAYGA